MSESHIFYSTAPNDPVFLFFYTAQLSHYHDKLTEFYFTYFYQQGTLYQKRKGESEGEK